MPAFKISDSLAGNNSIFNMGGPFVSLSSQSWLVIRLIWFLDEACIERKRFTERSCWSDQVTGWRRRKRNKRRSLYWYRLVCLWGEFYNASLVERWSSTVSNWRWSPVMEPIIFSHKLATINDFSGGPFLLLLLCSGPLSDRQIHIHFIYCAALLWINWCAKT